MNIEQLFDNIKPMIGNTPLLEIHFRYYGEERVIYAKAESYNMTGNIKDRVAYHILQRAYEKENIKPGDRIIEATSGNTGIAFSALGSYLGHPVTIFMPDWMSQERIRLMESYGATVQLVSKDEGGFLGSIRLSEELAASCNGFLPGQFSNEDNTETHYLYTGKEIADQLSALGLKADAVVAGVGTGGTIMGIGKRLKEVNPACKVHPLEPINSPTLSTGYKTGSHKIQGISDEFIPDLVHLDELDSVIAVDDCDSIIMARMLSEKLGLGVGISSGANFLGCIKAQELLGQNAIVTTVFADDNKKYLSTDYSVKQEMKADYYTNHIELSYVVAHK